MDRPLIDPMQGNPYGVSDSAPKNLFKTSRTDKSIKIEGSTIKQDEPNASKGNR
jgi:hypothetical protein